MPEHPMQPFVRDDRGVVRFKENKAVKAMLEVCRQHGFSLNEIATGGFSKDDMSQLSQLIGYSLSGFHELSHVTDATARRATAEAQEQGFKDACGCRNSNCEIHCGVK